MNYGRRIVLCFYFKRNFAGINRQGVTVLLVEQNANMALRCADLAYVLETGNITMSGSGQELLADERVKEAYLGKNS